MNSTTSSPIEDARISITYVRDELRLPANHRSASTPEYYVVVLGRALAALARLDGFKARPQVRTIADGPAFAPPPISGGAPAFEPSADDWREYARLSEFHERVEAIREGESRSTEILTDDDLAAAGLPVG